MEASFVDLRKKSKEIINAIKRKEKVTVLYRGKPAAIMNPINTASDTTQLSASKHKAFGMWAANKIGETSASDQVALLRRKRYDDL